MKVYVLFSFSGSYEDTYTNIVKVYQDGNKASMDKDLANEIADEIMDKLKLKSNAKCTALYRKLHRIDPNAYVGIYDGLYYYVREVDLV